MHKLIQHYKELRESEKKFISDGKRTIAKSNLKTLSEMSVAGIILMVIDLIAGFALIPGFVPSAAHIALLPILIVFAVASILYRNAGKNSPRVVTAMCLAFEIICYAITIQIDIFAHQMLAACFMPMIIIVFSATIFFPSRMQNIINEIFTITFVLCTLFYKVDYEWAWRYDVFFAIAGFGFATALGYHFRLAQIKNFTSKMRYKSLSMRDPLLENIYNKRGYEDAIDNYLVSKNPNVNCAFIVLDLNNFKHINDNYGHDMGDQILRCMSSTLLSLFRDSDIIGRFGGDEFIVLADGLCDEESIEKKCMYIAELIGRRAQETGAIKVFSSLGAVICEGQNVDFERLFELADEAMYEAKEQGRDADRFVMRRYTDSADRSFKKKEKNADEDF